MENNEYQNQPIMQPVQPVQPVSPMQPEPKKESKTALYLIIALLITLVVGVAAVLVVVLAINNKADEVEEKGKTAQSGTVEKRDEKRKNDIDRFLTAANDFQTNNAGKTPWMSGSTNEKFVSRYIDEKCELSKSDKFGRASAYTDADYADVYSCDADAKDFRDPDGNVYSFYVFNSAEILLMDNGTNDVSLTAVIGAWPNDHRIVVTPRSKCSDTDKKSVTLTFGPRVYSLAYRLESGEIYCADNH